MQQTSDEWLQKHQPIPVAKVSTETRSWFASLSGEDVYIKHFPHEFAAWGEMERAIAGIQLHPNIVALRDVITCSDGFLHIYERAHGENLAPSDARRRFRSLPFRERFEAVVTATQALITVVEAGFVVVDWYEGNMMYDHDAHRLWLFDWEACRCGSSFVLDMDQNYGASRLMAPEEFVRGSVIDERTLVYNVGRFALLALPDSLPTLGEVLAQATDPRREMRFRSLRKFRNGLGTAQ